MEATGTVKEPEFSITLKFNERITEEDVNSGKNLKFHV